MSLSENMATVHLPFMAGQIIGLSTEPEDAPRTLIGAAYKRLRQDIINGRYPAGEKLRVEHLKVVYSVSAGTLREALGLLVSDSLVVAQGQRGFRVEHMSLSDLADLTSTRVLVECEALRESIKLGGDDWEAGVVSAYHKLSLAEERFWSDAAGLIDEWEERNCQFHEALVAACNSRWIKKIRSLLYHQAERYRRLSATKGPPPVEVHNEHLEIYTAVMARDAAKASAVLAKHIERSLLVIKVSGLLK
jgi:GntR family transcriptional regulator, carbon starvation induced regulator